MLVEDVEVAGHEGIANGNTTCEHHCLRLLVECGCIRYRVAFVCVGVKKPVVDDWMWCFFKAVRVVNYVLDLLSKDHLKMRQTCRLRRCFYGQPRGKGENGLAEEWEMLEEVECGK